MKTTTDKDKNDVYTVPATDLRGTSFEPGSKVTFNGKEGTVVDWDHNEYGAAIYVIFSDGEEVTFVTK